MSATLPYGNITTPQELGHALRAKRKADGLTQAQAAALCGVGVRFLSDLEGGKPTAEVGKIMQIARGLGLELSLVTKAVPR